MNETSTHTNMNTFQDLQNDLSATDTKIWIQNGIVSLFSAEDGKLLATFPSGEYLVRKIKRWCEINNYRCSQIQNGALCPTRSIFIPWKEIEA